MAKLYPFPEKYILPSMKALKEDLWFKAHQRLLLKIANTDYGRDLLCIDKGLPPLTFFSKECARGVLEDRGKEGKLYISDYRIGSKWGNVIRYRWKDFASYAKRFYDYPKHGLTYIRLNGRQMLAATTTTFYTVPDPETGLNSVDGYVWQTYSAGSGVSWATIIAAAGSNFADNNTVLAGCFIIADTVSANWTRNTRGGLVFNTTTLPDGDFIAHAVLSIYGKLKQHDLGGTGPDVNIYGFTPAGNEALVVGDYTQFGSVAFSTAISYTPWTVSAYNDFILNDSGCNAISTTDATKFMFMNANFDAAQVSPNWNTGATSKIDGWAAEQTGTSNDPKLELWHRAGGGAGAGVWGLIR